MRRVPATLWVSGTLFACATAPVAPGPRLVEPGPGGRGQGPSLPEEQAVRPVRGDSWPACSEREGRQDCLFSFLGRLARGRVIPEAVCGATTEWMDGPGDGPCDPVRCGAVEVPPGMPTEMAFWLALTDFFRQRQTEAVAGQTQVEDGEAGHLQTIASRTSLRFSPGPGVACEATTRYYQEETRRPGDPMQEVLDHLRRQGAGPAWGMEMALGLLEEGQGAVCFKQCRVSEAPEYDLRVEVTFDVLGYREPAMVQDQAVVCRAPHPIRASQVPGVVASLQQEPEGLEQPVGDGWVRRLCVCPGPRPDL